ncbi:MAG: sigma-70 family RNA polymerase sigma factor [Anaerolineaceae bacterium]|nr:sigma-70 family RNA polymerase sigma factor [Anaerolineaceae bacterium]
MWKKTLPFDEEQELVKRAQAGDEQAFEELILAYTPALFQVVQRMVEDGSEVEMILQETFWRAWRSLDRYQADRPILPYLTTIAVNLLRDRWRSQKWLLDIDLDEMGDRLNDTLPSPEIQTIAKEELNSLKMAISKLPEAYRTVITLKYGMDFDYEEIANMLKMPINTVRTHLHRARGLLRSLLEENYG